MCFCAPGDELVGATSDQKPGRFDAGLVVSGVGLAAWNGIVGGASAELWVGIAAVVRGLPPPLRELLRRIEWPPSGLRLGSHMQRARER